MVIAPTANASLCLSPCNHNLSSRVVFQDMIQQQACYSHASIYSSPVDEGGGGPQSAPGPDDPTLWLAHGTLVLHGIFKPLVVSL